MTRAVGLTALALAAVLAVTACSGGGASAAPALRYAVFLGQMVSARESIQEALTNLVAAGNGAAAGQTADDVRSSAESIAAIAADQRDWLDENPPADCYVEAHHAAATVVESLSDASTAALGWADAMDSPELDDPATAYAAFASAAQVVLGDADGLGQALDETVCLD